MRPSKPVLPPGQDAARAAVSTRSQDVPTAAQLAGQVRALAAELQALRQSSSWRLTAPLRRAAAGRLRPRAAVGEAQAAYNAWLQRHLAEEPPPDPAASGPAPRISIVMPVYDPDPRWLRAAIDSVRAQSHAEWQLCIADDASTRPEVPALLAEYAAADARIQWVRRPANGHISAASNSALDLATGDWIALLDQDDLLAPHALRWVAREIQAHPRARLIYSDEDKVDASGRHFAPHFKPDWNAELLRSQNFVSHLGVYDARLVRELGGFRPGLEGAQDHDLVLRVSERLSGDAVRHIPRILYHWRAHAGSTAGQAAGGAKAYAEEAGRRAVQAHLDRLGRTDMALATPYGYRVKPRFFQAPPAVSVVVVGAQGAEGLLATARALVQRTAYPLYEIVLLDLEGSDGTRSALAGWCAQPGFAVVSRDAGEAVPSALRRAVAAAGGTLLCWMRAGLAPCDADWLDELAGRALQDEVGVVGGQVLDAQGRVADGALLLDAGRVAVPAFAGERPGEGGYFNRGSLAQQFSAVSGGFALLRRAAYEQAGGFGDNPASFRLAFVDLCLRLGAAGLRTVWSPYAECVQALPAQAGPDDDPTDELRFMTTRWRDVLARDPFHNPHLAPGRLAFDARRAAADPEGAE